MRRARGNLRQRLLRLRQSIGVQIVVGKAHLSIANHVTHDAAKDGELLPTVTLDHAAGLADWLDAMRSSQRRAHIEALAALASQLEAEQRIAEALVVAQQFIDADPTSEHGHRRLMRLHYLRGDRAAALSAFDRCCDVLERVLGVAPEPETEALRARVAALTLPPVARTLRQLPVSVARPPRLIGRDPELGMLQQAWHSRRLCTVIGEAGLGKSRLLATLLEMRPAAVCMAARPGDAGVPFATLARLLRAVVQHAAAGPKLALLPGVRQEVARVLPELGECPARPAESQRFALQRAIRALLDSVPGIEGLLIDDLHFADAASLDMLQALIDGTGDGNNGSALRWVLAYRPADAGSALRSLHDGLLDIALPARIALAPLDEASIASFVDSLALPGVRGAALAPTLLRRTGGNPLFMLETIKQAWSEGTLSGAVSGIVLPRPETVQQLIERRLSQLSPAALTLARVAAVAGADFSIELAGHVLEQPGMQLASAWTELESAQVLRDGSFAHDLVYETTLALVPGEIARHTHAAVARWLQAHTGEPERIAAHWIAAGDAERAIEPLRLAARRNTERTCLAEARACLEQAVRLCRAAGRDRDEFAVLVELHKNYIADDPGAGHEQLVQRLQALATDETERLDAAWARHNLLRFRQTTSPIAELEADLARAEKLGDERVLIAFVTMLVSGYITLERPDEAWARMQHHQPLLERSAQRAELPDFHGHLAIIFSEQDRFAEALHHVAHAAALNRDAGDTAEVMVLMCNQTRMLRLQGRMAAAQELFERIDRWHAASAPNPRAWLVSRVGAGEVLRELGRYDEALQALDHREADMRQHMGPLYAAALLARAKIWLALGQHARARQTLDAIGSDRTELPDWLHAQCDLLAAQVAARIRGGGSCDEPSDQERALLEAGARAAPRQSRRSTWLECELQRAAWADPETGAALAENIATVAVHHALVGHAQQARLCEAAQRLAAGQIDTALRVVRQAQAFQQHRFPGAAGAETVLPCGGSAVERDLTVVRVLLAAQQPDAQTVLDAAGAHLQGMLTQHVPAEFHDSFLHRNPANLKLMTLLRNGSLAGSA
jgi:tetratricopeptide (TPR) repeat protein